jgi:hypothetical protein
MSLLLNLAMLLGSRAVVMGLLSCAPRTWKYQGSDWGSQRSAVPLRVMYLLLILSIVALVLLHPAVSRAESPDEAIMRIRQGPHVPMPPPQMAYTSGLPGKGMSIENRTDYLLRWQGSPELSLISGYLGVVWPARKLCPRRMS